MKLSISPETGEPLPRVDSVTGWRLQLMPPGAGRPRICRDEAGDVLVLNADATEEEAAPHGAAGYSLVAIGIDADGRKLCTRPVELDTDGVEAEEEGSSPRDVIEAAALAITSLSQNVQTLTDGIIKLAGINAEAAAAPQNEDRATQLLELVTAAINNKKAEKAPPVDVTPAATGGKG